MFRVDATSYIKEKHAQVARRSFIFNGSSTEDVKSWIYFLNYATEACEMLNDSSQDMIERRTSLTKGFDGVANSFYSDVDAYVDVTVVGTNTLSDAEVFGASNCYICCSIGSDQHFTSVSFSSDNKYEWRENFIFPLTSQQWAQERLLLTARTKKRHNVNG